MVDRSMIVFDDGSMTGSRITVAIRGSESCKMKLEIMGIAG